MKNSGTKEVKKAMQELVKNTRKLIDVIGTMGLLWLKEEVDKKLNEKQLKGDKKRKV